MPDENATLQPVVQQAPESTPIAPIVEEQPIVEPITEIVPEPIAEQPVAEMAITEILDKDIFQSGLELSSASVEERDEALFYSNPGSPDDDGGKHYNQVVQP